MIFTVTRVPWLLFPELTNPFTLLLSPSFLNLLHRFQCLDLIEDVTESLHYQIDGVVRSIVVSRVVVVDVNRVVLYLGSLEGL